LYDKIKKSKLFFIVGNCAIENYKILFETARFVKKLKMKYGCQFIFKASYDKANRTSYDAYRGLGIKRGIELLTQVKILYDLPILTDVHSVAEIKEVEKSPLDILQIPAFLCRQTDLVGGLAKTGRIINIKKGQFIAPDDIVHVIKKIESQNNTNIILTERGTSFGYHRLVVDFTGFTIMKQYYPVVFDCTHSVQLPSAGGNKSLGNKEFILPLARASVAYGVNGIFMEIHPTPKKALCDGSNSLNFSEAENVVKQTLKIMEGM